MTNTLRVKKECSSISRVINSMAFAHRKNVTFTHKGDMTNLAMPKNRWHFIGGIVQRIKNQMSDFMHCFIRIRHIIKRRLRASLFTAPHGFDFVHVCVCVYVCSELWFFSIISIEPQADAILCSAYEIFLLNSIWKSCNQATQRDFCISFNSSCWTT